MARKAWEGEKRSLRDTALDGTFPRPGTKGHLRMLMAAAGWESEALQPAPLRQTRSRLFDLQTEVSNKKTHDLDGFVTELRKTGIHVDAIPKSKGVSTQWVRDLWDSMTRNPWWLSTTGGQRSLLLVATSTERAEVASSLFLHDVFSAVGEEPEWRMPTFRRTSLVALMSPEMLNRFMEGPGSSTDILVVHGGFLDEDTLYQNFGYLNAVQSMFKGFLIYEAIVPQGDNPSRVAAVARRSGFPTVLGVG